MSRFSEVDRGPSRRRLGTRGWTGQGPVLSWGVAEPGRRLSTGLGDLYEAVRGRRALVEQPRGWAGKTAARGPGCSGARLGPVVHGSGCRDPLVGCGPGWSIWSRCIRVSDTGYFWWRPRGGGESTPVRRSRAWTRVGRVGSRRGAGWRHPVSGRQVYAALRPPVGQPYQ